MRHAIRKHLGDFVAILVLFVIALGVGRYILANQRLRFPFIEDKPFTLKAEFSDAQAVTPGQGQTVRVAGVRVGDITKVELEDGQRDRDDRARPEVQGPRPHGRDRAAAAQDRPEGHVHRARPGHGTAPVAKEDGRSRSRTRARRRPGRDPLGARHRHARLPQAADQRRRQGPQGPRQRPARRLPRASSRPTATSRASHGAVADAPREPAPADPLAATSSTRARRPRRRARRSSSTPPRAVFRAFASEDQTSPAAVASCRARCSQTTDTLRQGPALRRRARPDAQAPAPAGPPARHGQPRGAPVRQARPRRSCATRSARSCATPVRWSATCARPRTNLAEADARPDAAFASLNRFFNMLGYNPNGREGPSVASRPRRGLPVLARLGPPTMATQLFSSSRRPRRASARSRSAAPATHQRDRPQQPAASSSSAMPDRPAHRPAVCG